LEGGGRGLFQGTSPAFVDENYKTTKNLSQNNQQLERIR